MLKIVCYVRDRWIIPVEVFEHFCALGTSLLGGAPQMCDEGRVYAVDSLPCQYAEY